MSYGGYGELSDEELATLLERRRRMYEEMLRRRQMEEEARRIAEMREAILRTILTDEARERLARLKLVRPELATAVENHLIALAQQGRIQSRITDDQLKALLRQIASQTQRREPKIVFKRK